MSSPAKKNLGEILDNVDTTEFAMALGMSMIAALFSFIGLSYMTGSSTISTAVGLVVAPISLYIILRKIANLPRGNIQE